MASVSEAAVLQGSVHDSVMRPSEALQGQADEVSGYDFNAGVDYSKLLASMARTGFQASHLGHAIATVNQMLDWRLSDERIAEDASDEEMSPAYRRNIDVIVTTAGGVEEDLIKCLAPTYMGDFAMPGVQLRSKGLNRIGNLLVPNENYCKFENWVLPVLDQLLVEQKEQGIIWTPSKVIARLGREVSNPASVCYWAQKNGIPIYCPALTDGSLGDMIYFHSYRNPGLVIDIVQDITAMNNEAVHAGLRKTGIIVLGGGVPKHHVCNANMMRNGADFSVFINTAQEFDGSDSGARPDEAISWGKIRGDSDPVKVHCDATIAFPLLVAETFAKRFHQKRFHQKKDDVEQN